MDTDGHRWAQMGTDGHRWAQIFFIHRRRGERRDAQSVFLATDGTRIFFDADNRG